MSRHNQVPDPRKVNAELARQATDMADFIVNNPMGFSKAFAEGLRGVARQASSSDLPGLPGIDIGPGDAISAMERLNLANPTPPREGEVIIGGNGENDLRLSPEGAVVFLGTVFGRVSGESLRRPIEAGLRGGGEQL